MEQTLKVTRIRIVGDGTPYGTRVMDENGNTIEGVRRVSFELDANQTIARAEIEVGRIDYDVRCDTTTVGICPYCKRPE